MFGFKLDFVGAKFQNKHWRGAMVRGTPDQGLQILSPRPINNGDADNLACFSCKPIN